MSSGPRKNAVKALSPYQDSADVHAEQICELLVDEDIAAFGTKTRTSGSMMSRPWRNWPEWKSRL
jgi:hypothetical protein